MIDAIFNNLMAQPGIHASMVLNGSGKLVASRGNSIYDRALLEGVSSALARALDSVDLLHTDWSELHVQFADGFLMIRDLGTIANQDGRMTLAVVADTSLNRSFATVAMRVVVQKLKSALASGLELQPATEGSGSEATMTGGATAGALHPTAEAAHLSGSQASPSRPLATPQAPENTAVRNLSHETPTDDARDAPADPYPGGSTIGIPPGQSNPLGPPHQSVMSSSLAWSGVANNKSSSTGVAVADEASSALLSNVAKSLAPFVGPMAKVFVKEAVREVCRDAPFSRDRLGEVLRALESQIEDPRDCRDFRSSVQSSI